MKTIINNEIKNETKQEVVNQNSKYFDENGNIIIEASAINQIGNRLQAIDTIAIEIKKALVPGIDNDYAIIPGTKKPSLLQPGARKICLMLGLTSHYSNISEHNNILTLKCELFYGDKMISESFAAESVGTKRDRGWEYNKALKIAQKRAFVGATLQIANLTKLFTQDTEDMGVVSPKKEELIKEEINDFYQMIKNKNKLTGKVSWDTLRPLVNNMISDFNTRHMTQYKRINDFSKKDYLELMDENKAVNPEQLDWVE